MDGFSIGLGGKVVGAVIALASITIMLPITNTIPSLAITLAAVGLLQRDGLFTLAGVALASAWIGLLVVMAGGLIFGASFAVQFVNEHLPWLSQWIGP
ncbi:MAG: exopolysaccharide biosynthesis protein [Hyphomonadaceae bacterium]|nr:exopolysaccharide biosynthesis protein [Hyphomonadaceae bacterium]